MIEIFQISAKCQVCTGPMWLLNTWDLASMIEQFNFNWLKLKCKLNLNLNSPPYLASGYFIELYEFSFFLVIIFNLLFYTYLSCELKNIELV
jgi:hypothetical protein